MSYSDKTSVNAPIEAGMAHANLDFTYGPYESIEAALIALPIDGNPDDTSFDPEADTLRAVGLQIGIWTDETHTHVNEYWFDGGILDNDLVVKNTNVQIATAIDPDTIERDDMAVSPKAVYDYIEGLTTRRLQQI